MDMLESPFRKLKLDTMGEVYNSMDRHQSNQHSQHYQQQQQYHSCHHWDSSLESYGRNRDAVETWESSGSSDHNSHYSAQHKSRDSRSKSSSDSNVEDYHFSYRSLPRQKTAPSSGDDYHYCSLPRRKAAPPCGEYQNEYNTVAPPHGDLEYFSLPMESDIDYYQSLPRKLGHNSRDLPSITSGYSSLPRPNLPAEDSAMQIVDYYSSRSSGRGRHQLKKSYYYSEQRVTSTPMNATPSKGLMGKGQMKLQTYVNSGMLTVHVQQARHLSTFWKPTCDTYVKFSLVPDVTRRTRCRTELVCDTNHPRFNEKFSFEILEDDMCKRLLISVWHYDTTSGSSDFLGCMSFGLKNILRGKNTVDGWYHLLTEASGRKKHSKAASSESDYHQLVKEPSTDNLWSDSCRISLQKDEDEGYGFTVTGSNPVQVCSITPGSAAELCGLQISDCIVRVNHINVPDASTQAVARLIRQCTRHIVLQVVRPKLTNKLPTSPHKPKPLSPQAPKPKKLSRKLSDASLSDRSVQQPTKKRRKIETGKKIISKLFSKMISSADDKENVSHVTSSTSLMKNTSVVTAVTDCATKTSRLMRVPSQIQRAIRTKVISTLV